MHHRRLLLLLTVLGVASVLLLVSSGPQAEAGFLQPPPGACHVCWAAKRVDLRMAPFQDVRRFRCAHAPAGIVWPRGRVRLEDMRVVDLDLGRGLDIYERLDNLYATEHVKVSPWQRFGGFEIRRGWCPLHTRVLRDMDLDSNLFECGAVDREDPEYGRWLNGMRFELQAEALLGGDLAEPFEVNLGLDGGLDLGGCGSPMYSTTLEYVPKDDVLEHALAEAAGAAWDQPPWVGTLLEAQALFDAGYFAGAHESARQVLLAIADEPHAVALIYATYVESRGAFCARAVDFGTGVLERVQRERERAGIVCELERRGRRRSR